MEWRRYKTYAKIMRKLCENMRPKKFIFFKDDSSRRLDPGILMPYEEFIISNLNFSLMHRRSEHRFCTALLDKAQHSTAQRSVAQLTTSHWTGSRALILHRGHITTLLRAYPFSCSLSLRL